MGVMSSSATDLGHRARHSDWLDHAVRIGLVAYGVVHLMVAWLAAQLALGDREGSASSQGALHELAQQPFGEVLVWLVALGMFLLVLWRVLEAAGGHRDEEHRTRKRLVSAGKAVIYAAIGISALAVAMGSGGGSGGTDSTTKKLMDLPAGPWIVGAVGLAIIGYGVGLAVQAWTEKFAEHLSLGGKTGDTGTAYLWFGKAGYVAKGVAAAIVGGLFVYAAVTHDPKQSGGLDQALQKVLQQPFGQVLLLVIAAGIACYGLFCFAQARHLSR